MEQEPSTRKTPTWLKVVTFAVLSLFLTFGLILLFVWLLTPEKLSLSLSAKSLNDGPRTVALRAIDAGDLTKELYKTSVGVEVKDGILKAEWLPPAELQGKPYVIELCAKEDGDTNEDCFYEKTDTSNTADTDMAGGEPLRSCPYFVSEVRSSKLSNLVNANMVSLDNRVLCGDGDTAAGAEDFSPVSRIDQLQSLKTPGFGLSLSDGLLVADNGEIKTLSMSDLVTQISDELETTPSDQGGTTVVQQFYPTTNNYVTNSYGGTDSQTLSISGRTISISGGNSIELPPDAGTAYPYASATTDGILSSTDWNNFAAKENSLTFSGGLTRTGDTISLMSCAAGQVLKSDGTAWVCAADSGGTSTYSAGTGISISPTNVISNTGILGVTSSGALTTTTGQTPAITLSTTSDLTQLSNQLGLSDTGVTAGTYNNVTVDSKGRVTAGTNVSYLTSYTETDGVIGNEIADVVTNGGLVMTGAGTAADPYKVGLVTTCSDGQLLKYTAAGGWACASDIDTDTTLTEAEVDAYVANNGYLTSEVDGSTTNEIQSLTWNTSTNELTISGGNTVDISSVNTDSQAISLSGDTLSISGNAATVDLSKYLDNTDSQTLSWDGGTRTLSLTNGGSVVIPDSDTNTTYTAGSGLSLTGTVFSLNAPTCDSTTEKLIFNGTALACATDLDTNTDTNTTYTASGGIELNGTTFSLAQQGAALGDVLHWDGTAWTPMTPSTFSDTDDQTLSYNSATRELTISEGNTITFPLASSTTTGMLSSADWATFNGKENVLTFSDGLVRSGNTVTLMSCAAGQILQSNSTGDAWLCADQVVDTDTNTTYSAGTGLSLTGTTFANTGTLSVSASGALSSSGGQNPAITLSTTADFSQLNGELALTDTGVTAGTYNNVTVDSRGRVTAGTNVTYLTSEVDGVVGNEVADVTNGGGLVMTGAGTAADPYKVGLITTCSDGQLLKYTAAGGWACASDIDTNTPNTDNQTLTWNTTNNQLTISGGNTVDISSVNTDSQSISLSGDTLSISGNAATVDLSKYLDNTDNQTLSWNSGTRTLSLTNGGSVVITDTDTTYSAAANGGLTLSGTAFSLMACTEGEVLKASATTGQWECAADIQGTSGTTYTAGTGITINTSNVISSTLGSTIEGSEITDGTITPSDLANSGATAGTYGDSGVSVAQLTVNAQGQVTAVSNRTLPTAGAATTGVLSSTDWTTFNGKENVLTFSDGLTRSSNTVTLMDCAANQILQRNSGDTAWLCADQVVDTDTNTTYTAGTGLSLTGTTFANTGVLSVSSSGALVTDNTNAQTPAITLSTTSDLTQLSNQLGLSDTGVTAGTYNNVTVDSKGRVTAATNVSYLTSYTETDAVIGNEIADVVTNGGLVMTGAGTAADPYKVGLVTTCSDGQLLKYYSTDPDGAGPLVAGWNCASDIDTDTTLTEAEVDAYVANNGYLTSEVDGSTTNELQTLTWNTSTNELTISGGNTVDISSVNTDSQAISLSGDTLSISGNAATVDLSKYLDNTDSQTLSWDGGTRTLSLTNGGSVVIPDADTDTTYSAAANGGLALNGTAFSLMSCTTGQVLKASATAGQWECAADLQGTTGDVVLGTDTAGNYVESLTAGSGIKILGTAGEGWTPTVAFADGTANGQYWSWNATTSAWELAAAPTDTNTTYTAGSGLALSGTSFSIDCSTNPVAFCNGGNSFGTEATLGTNDAFGINFESGGVTAATLSATGEWLLKDPSNSTVSFQTQDSAGLAMFTIDTVNKTLQVGGVADTTAVMLILDAYNVATDPVGQNGAMYYNTALGKFRCYEAGAWKDCIAGGRQVLVRGFDTTSSAMPSSYGTFIYDTITTNVGGAYNTTTGVFTAPETGWYNIKASLTVTMPVSTSGNSYVTFGFRSNASGNLESELAGGPSSTSNTTGYFASADVDKLVHLSAGERITFVTSYAAASAPTTYPALAACTVQITREYDVR